MHFQRPLAVTLVACLAFLLAADAPQKRGPIVSTPHGDIEIFPHDNAWNTDISQLPVHPRSADYIASIGVNKGLHPDFGTVWNNAPMGIPYCVATKDTKRVAVTFEYANESDAGPYPIPENAPIEGGPQSTGDRHILILVPHEKKLYELYAAYPPKDGKGWTAGSGAIFDLTSNKTRPAGWTSADAAGLPIFPGLARYDEAVVKGKIEHALRFTCKKTQRGYIAPATHWASKSKEEKLPPMGLRVRLKASYDISKAPKSVQPILAALKTYGMILADNGGDWFISGAPDPKWNDEELNWMKRIKGSDLECVDTGPITRG